MKINAYSLKLTDFEAPRRAANNNAAIACNWKELYSQLLTQWEKLTEEELDKTGANCSRIASLLQRKYQIPQDAAEEYIHHFQRNVALFGS